MLLPADVSAEHLQFTYLQERHFSFAAPLLALSETQAVSLVWHMILLIM